MKEILLNVKLARAVAQILRARWTGTPLSNAVCHAFSDIIMVATAERTAADLALKSKIITAVEFVASGDNVLVDVDVCCGVAELRGIIPNERIRREIHDIVSAIGGISTVHDHLIDINVASGAFLLSEEDAACDCNIQPPLHPAQSL